MACKGEVHNIPERGGGNFEQNTEGGTASVARGTILLTQVGCPQSTGGQQDSKSNNLEEPPGVSQVHIPVRSQMDCQLY